jgi:hypothetical protein
VITASINQNQKLSLKSNGLILTATLKVKTLGKIVALLGVCGRIGKNDAQNKTLRK